MNRLRQLRRERKLSQLRLAMELNVTQASISKYEIGQSFPDIEVLIAMARFFNVSVDYLLELTPFKSYSSEISLSTPEMKCLSLFNSLSIQQKNQAIAYMTGLKLNK